jgi:hypothetical protein
MQKLIELILSLIGKASFASFTYTTKKTGETSRYNVLLGAKYIGLLERSLLELSLLDTSAMGIEASLLPVALDKVKASLEKSLAAHKQGEQNPDYTKQNQYVPLGAGLNANTTDNTLQLFGLVQSKVVLKPGEHKAVVSSPLTIATSKIKRALPIGKFREFALDVGNIHGARLSGDTLVMS